MSCFGSAKKTASDESRIVRPFGPMERYQAAFLSLGYYGCVVVTCRYAVPSAYRVGPGTQALYDALERAVALAVLEHPLLQVGVVGSETKCPSWVRLDRIDLRHHITWHTAEDGAQSEALVFATSQAAHDAPFTHPETRPGWKIHAVHCPAENHLEVIFAYRHTIGDGTSGKVFHLTLLEKLNVPNTDTPVLLKGHVLEVPPVANFTPTSDELLKIKLTPAFVLAELVKLLGPRRFGPAIRSCDSWAPNQPGPLNTRVRFFRLGDEALRACLGACRQHGTTLTGLVHALALASLVARTAGDGPGRVQSGTPISMRRFARRPGRDPERTVMNCVSYCFHRFDAGELEKLRPPPPARRVPAAGGEEEEAADDDDDENDDREAAIWAVAARVRGDLVRQLGRGTKNELGGLLKFVSDHRGYLAGAARKPRQTSLECSNLGVLDGGAGAALEEASAEHEPWTIDQALFSQSANLTGTAVAINPIAVQGKVLSVSFCWQGGVAGDAVVEGLAADVEAWLNQLGREGHLKLKREC